MKKETSVFTIISAIVGIVTVIILIIQHRERKEIIALDKQLKQYELERVKNNLG